ncbi:GNAT family N-acetyltransferase [Brevundimonas sp. AJA228-03]|uniref:GNAT family N-acetyltransferase n=1 Tax=Brevundimonas sp. AJA228-03 TaxID=2752515 RepID=UPI001AE007EF|nr:GNAT family N-acetyltransferase [Brevundimonas sp. AJA228-03]QTN19273.1 GNAT family N-acetyltransferase [Brevundimonas sp. AJA228-03]
MIGPTTRISTLDDLPALHRLIERAYRGETAKVGWTNEADLLDGQRTDVEELTEILTDPARIMLLAEDAGAMVACLQLVDEGGGTAYLGMLSVEPELQAGGLGRFMIAAAEAEAVARFGADTMRMTVIRQRPELIAWYERRGYVRTGETEPFPLSDERFGLPRRQDLEFVVLAKGL